MTSEIVQEYEPVLKAVLLSAGITGVRVLVRGSSIVLTSGPNSRIDLDRSRLGGWCVRPVGHDPITRFGQLKGALPRALRARIKPDFSFYQVTTADRDLVSSLVLYLLGKPLGEVFPKPPEESGDHSSC